MISIFVKILFGESKVNQINFVSFRIISNYEIVRLDISMNDSLEMEKLYSLKHLDCDHQYSFEIELFIAHVKKFLERGSQQIHCHDIKSIFRG